MKESLSNSYCISMSNVSEYDDCCGGLMDDTFESSMGSGNSGTLDTQE